MPPLIGLTLKLEGIDELNSRLFDGRFFRVLGGLKFVGQSAIRYSF